MATQFRLAVLPMILYQGTTNYFGSLGEQEVAWMFGDAPLSVPGFFRTASAGEVTVKAEIFRHAVVTDPAIIDAVTYVNPADAYARTKSAQAALDRVGAGVCPPSRLRGFDGLVFLVAGAEVNAGATTIRVDGAFKRVAFISDGLNHQFLCHEVGHVLGLAHPHQLAWNNPWALHGEYGNPADIMSSATFGFSAPDHPGMTPDPAGGSVLTGDTVFWESMGPAPSRATLWRFAGGFPNIPGWARELDGAAPAEEIELKRASLPGLSLVAIRKPGEANWWTIEYRPAVGWDAGLTQRQLGPSASAGLVICETRDIGSPGEEGYPRAQAINYLTTIPTPVLGGDSDWSGPGFGIRILSATDATARLLVGRLPGTRGASVVADAVSSTEVPSGIGPEEWVAGAGPECAEALVRMERVATREGFTVSARSWGFEKPRFHFSVNGIGVPDGPNKAVVVPVRAFVPTGWATGSEQIVRLAVGSSTSPGTLELSVPGGTGTFSLAITLRVREDNGTGGPDAHAGTTIAVTTLQIVPPRDALDAIMRCLGKKLRELDARAIPTQKVRRPRPIEDPDWLRRLTPSNRAVFENLRVLQAEDTLTAQAIRTSLVEQLGTGLSEGQLGELIRTAT